MWFRQEPLKQIISSVSKSAAFLENLILLSNPSENPAGREGEIDEGKEKGLSRLSGHISPPGNPSND